MGLVRAMAPDGWRHVYAAGRVPVGLLIGELGALRAEPAEDATPVWVVDDGRVVTGEYDPEPARPARGAVVRWILAPLTWTGSDGLRTRLGASWARLRVAGRLRNAVAAPRSDLPDQPDGYLDQRPGDNTIPLHAGIHPITGDQLLAFDHWAIVDAGYRDVALIGYLAAVAPVTGELGVQPCRLPWASRFGQSRRTKEWADRPLADIDPLGGRLQQLPAVIRGWAWFPDELVARVDLTLDGRALGPARTGHYRPDLVGVLPGAGSVVAGWEYLLAARALPTGAATIVLGGTAHGSRGGRVALPDIEVEVSGAEDIGARTVAPAPKAVGGRPPGRATAGHGPRVLAVTHGLDHGGAQLYLVELLTRLARRLELTGTVIAPADGALRADLEAAGFQVHLSPEPPIESADIYEARMQELAAWAADGRFDLAFVNTLAAFRGVDLAERIGIPALLAVHESFAPSDFWATRESGPDEVVRGRLQRALTSASLVVFESQATRRYLLPYGDADRFVTLPYGIDLAAIDRFRATFDPGAARRSLGVAADDRVVLCLGPIEPRKGQVALTQAFALAREAHPDALLALVGLLARPPQAARSYSVGLRQYVARAGLSSRTVIAPLVPEPYAWHGIADVLVCSSDSESLPRVLLEAMAFETPVVSTSVFGVPEIVEDGVTGYLCDVRDVGDLGGALQRALDAPPAERRELIRAADTRVRKHHDADRYADAMGRIVEAVATNQGASVADALVAP